MAALGTLIYLLFYAVALGLLGHGLSAAGWAGLPAHCLCSACRPDPAHLSAASNDSCA
jgi:hypothetical protein